MRLSTIASRHFRGNVHILSTNLNFKHNSDFLQADEKLIYLLKSCNQASEISQIHGCMVKSGLDHVSFPLSKLLESSSRLDIKHAASIFKHVSSPSLYMFNTMLRGYSITSPKQALVVFNKLRTQSILLDQFSFVTTLKACARESETQTGQGLHGIVIRSGHALFINVKNTLLHLYCVCGSVSDAHKLFCEMPEQNDLVSYNTLMGGYLHASQSTMVLDLFRKMFKRDLKPGFNTALCVLCASGELEHPLLGQSFHGFSMKTGFCSDLYVITSLICMYANCGQIELGCRIFDGVAKKDVIIWNCLIDKYAKNGQVVEAIALLHKMKHEGMKPNSSTLAGLLSSCASSGAIKIGRYVSDYVEEERLELDAVLGTALVDMYSKCGFLEKASDVFNGILDKDVKSYTAMINGFGVHGETKEAIRVFHKMEEASVPPNETTFLAVLSACSHGGLVKEGIECFERMVHKYGILPKMQHYGCVVDLLGRAGLLEEAHGLIKNLPFSDSTAWRALLAACRVYGDVELGECVKRVLVDVFHEHPSDSMLLSSTYAIAGRIYDYTTKEAGKLPVMKEEKIMVKEAGCSFIEMES